MFGSFPMAFKKKKFFLLLKYFISSIFWNVKCKTFDFYPPSVFSKCFFFIIILRVCVCVCVLRQLRHLHLVSLPLVIVKSYQELFLISNVQRYLRKRRIIIAPLKRPGHSLGEGWGFTSSLSSLFCVLSFVLTCVHRLLRNLENKLKNQKPTRVFLGPPQKYVSQFFWSCVPFWNSK